MIILRTRQLEQFEAARCNRLFLAMQEFMSPMYCQASPDLPVKVREFMSQASGYGITSEHDLYGYFGLIQRYGWDFEHQPGNEWMAAALVDNSFTSPSDRLTHLITRCDALENAATANASVARDSGLGAVASVSLSPTAEITQS